MTVLAVDDNSDILDGFSEVLQSDGHVAWVARSADDALARLTAEPVTPDVVLLDLRMPGMSAATFASLVKNSVTGASIRIVLVTAVREDEIPAGLQVDAVLHKPFPMERLLEVVRSVVAGPR